MQKSVGGHFELAVWIDVTRINMSCFFTIIKTVSISCNWTYQLLFTYKMALCTSHSHSFVCGWSIVIKFTYLTDIYLASNWWKIQQNMPGRFLEIPVFLGDYFIMPHPVYVLIQFHNLHDNSQKYGNDQLQLFSGHTHDSWPAVWVCIWVLWLYLQLEISICKSLLDSSTLIFF